MFMIEMDFGPDTELLAVGPHLMVVLFYCVFIIITILQ